MNVSHSLIIQLKTLLFDIVFIITVKTMHYLNNKLLLMLSLIMLLNVIK